MIPSEAVPENHVAIYLRGAHVTVILEVQDAAAVAPFDVEVWSREATVA